MSEYPCLSMTIFSCLKKRWFAATKRPGGGVEAKGPLVERGNSLHAPRHAKATGETGGAFRACTLPPGRLLLDDTEPQVSDCRLFDHLHWLQLNGCDADVIEQANPLAQEQRHEMKLDFVEESRL